MSDDQYLSRVERRKRELEREQAQLNEQARHETIHHQTNEEDLERSESGKQAEATQGEHPFLHRADEQSSEPKKTARDIRKSKLKPKLTLPFGTKRKSKPRRDERREPRRQTREPERNHVKHETAAPKDKPRRRKWKGKLLLVLLLILIGVGYMGTRPVTFLVMGSDARVGESLSGSRTDSLQLMEFVPRSRTVQNVSIPRDTYTAIPCEPEREGDKITHAFAYGGADCTVGAVEGLTETSVDGQVVITFETFMELIDLVGGVNVTATHSFSEKGFNQTYEYTEGVSYAMDGDMALAYARHRKTDTDGARSNRQTEVMSAVADKLASPTGWTKIPATYRFMKDEMGLEMNPLQMASIGMTMVLQPQVDKLQIEGEDAYIDNIYYYQPTEASVQAIRDALDLTMWGTVR
ncbi:LytR family transcriptional regulator [Exiguobacterium sp. SL-10]|uniref:LCP family protein n=1 Tax=Exiguobacterium sp. SL-10 TaxID=2510962 RepID=UPI00103FABDE|nr:LCP family protein [Exiguobacterium sp. SL-10]TCI28972.1 LytR family transcriptional regulator [Exiguobacterium sp. SL-10]